MSDFECYFKTALYIFTLATALIQIKTNRDIWCKHRAFVEQTIQHHVNESLGPESVGFPVKSQSCHVNNRTSVIYSRFTSSAYVSSSQRFTNTATFFLEMNCTVYSSPSFQQCFLWMFACSMSNAQKLRQQLLILLWREASEGEQKCFGT